MASNRLDRWYLNDLARKWLGATKVGTKGLQSDHKGAAIHVRYPTNPIRTHKAQRVYPVPSYAKEHVEVFVIAELQRLSAELAASDLTAEAAAAKWVSAKVRISLGMLRAKREAKHIGTGAFISPPSKWTGPRGNCATY
ncbi:unnamed protein product [Phytophthora fragariaefolia]|uniref:Unnamed protein product n=1 Tax=Phytophthora fragariaefolia TaxID=1490495 RepID=A0A9W6XTF4_9STRA|nr:unnamed protein product [Phytophthora fragariaefolia]